MDDRKYLQLAKELAMRSHEPTGCGSLLVNRAGEIVASNFNSQRQDGLTASHAEMKSIAEANRKLGRKLNGLTAYGNCEPCTMCLTALVFAEVDRIVFSDRLNDLVEPAKQINIDCFEFVANFPNPPTIQQVGL